MIEGGVIEFNMKKYMVIILQIEIYEQFLRVINLKCTASSGQMFDGEPTS